MKTIIYKKMLNQYRITEIQENRSDEICVKFDEPIEAKLIIGKSVYGVSCGIAKISKSKLPDGEIYPELYTGAGKEKLESFIMLSGVPFAKGPDEEYVKLLAEAYENIQKKLDEYGEDILKIKERLDQKLKF